MIVNYKRYAIEAFRVHKILLLKINESHNLINTEMCL